MIYLFYGNDTKNKRKAYDAFAKSLAKVPAFTFIKNDFNREQVQSFFSGAGLFFDTCAIFFENVFENEDTADFVLKHLPEMAASQNTFVFVDGKFLKPELDLFKKARAEINAFELPKEKLEKYDNFVLANDFGARNKLNLWIHYREAVDAGVKLEELVGVLFWKAKDLLLKKNFSKFSEVELQKFVQKIAFILPESRTQGRDDETAFEQFLLEAF